MSRDTNYQITVIAWLRKIYKKIANSLSGPFDVNVVSPNPLLVEITNPLPYDFEVLTYPDLTTGTWWTKVIRFDNQTGVVTESNQTDTGVLLDSVAPKTDIEYRDRCDVTTKTVWNQTIAHVITTSGTTETLLSEVDSKIPCNGQYHIEILCRAGFNTLVTFEIMNDGSLVELSQLTTTESCDCTSSSLGLLTSWG